MADNKTKLTGLFFARRRRRRSTTDLLVSWRHNDAAPVVFDAWAFDSTGALNNYTLDAQPATFAIAGQDATLVVPATLDAQPGSFVHTGQVSSLIKNLSLVANSASFSQTVQYATIVKSSAINAQQNAFTITGQSSVSVSNRLLTSDATSLATAGQSASFVYGRVLSSESNAFAISGQSAELIQSSPNNTIAADVGIFSVSGQDANISRARIISVESESLAIIGQSDSFVISRNFVAAVGSFDILGQYSGLVSQRVLSAERKGVDYTYVVTGYVGQGYVSQDDSYKVEYGFVGNGYVEPGYVNRDPSASISVNRVIQANDGAIVISGLSATLELNRSYTINDTSMRRLTEIWQRMELDATNPVTITDSTLQTGSINQSISASGATRSGAVGDIGAVNQDVMIEEVWQRLGLDSSNPLIQTPQDINFGAINLKVSQVGSTVTVMRQ